MLSLVPSADGSFDARRLPTLIPRDTEGYILLVEDCEEDAFLTRRALQKAGVTNPVLTVDDGVAALELVWAKVRAGERLPGLVLLDTRLPRKDGFEVLESLRSGGATAAIPVIMLTSCALGEARFVAGDFGQVAFLRKPLRPDGLMATARELGVEIALRAAA